MYVKAFKVRIGRIAALISFLLNSALVVVPAAYGVEGQGNKTTMFKVGGDYVVKTIVKNADDSFYVEFHSVAVNGRADVIKLVADHLHMGIKEGDTLRISAEVTADKGAVVEANQILVFLPRIEGPVPVWLLSKKGRRSDLKGADYLKMHVPQSDYLIL